MAKFRELTTKEIHLLGVIITGSICRRGGVITKHGGLWKRRVDDKTVIVFEGHLGNVVGYKHENIKEEIVAGLCASKLINLIPPPTNCTYKFIGIWNINQKELEDHPQYNEIRAQGALNT